MFNLSKRAIMAGIEIVTVTSRSELKDFIDLPWTIYADYPQWVPPLKKEVRRMLDPGTHPFWEFSERILFLARRGKKNVGRIAGIIDRHHNEFHREQMGIWGFFECADDRSQCTGVHPGVPELGRWAAGGAVSGAGGQGQGGVAWEHARIDRS